MAFSSLFTLLDDIASLLDDVSVMTQVAAKKTVGVVGDDLALNANQVTGATAERELPIVWAVAKGSLVNKVIFIEKRHDLIKHLLGLLMIIGNIRKYRTTYSKYACKTLKNDIYDFFKINVLRIKKILYA